MLTQAHVALIIAGGTSSGFPASSVPRPKPLLPVNGQPIIGYVIRALEQSAVEKIFIIHDAEVDLPAYLPACPKCVFFKKDRETQSHSASLFLGLENVAAYYGPTEITQKSILIVPCDTPLVTPANFNHLFAQAAGNGADVTIAIISQSLLKNHFPQRSFRSGYLADYKGCYTLQMIGFVSGRLLQLVSPSKAGESQLAFRGVDEEHVTRFQETWDVLRKNRSHNYRLPRFTEKLVLRWLVKRGYATYLLQGLFDLVLRRLTMSKIMTYLNQANQVNAAYIISEEVEISIDIDRPEDFPIVLGVPWRGK